MVRTFARKLFIAVTAIGVTLMLVGGSYALTGGSGEGDEAPVEATTDATESPEPEPTDTTEEETEDGDEDGGVHGGSVPRVHEGCEGVEGLEGNWTHGDYVSAVGRQSGSEAKKAAAHSDCGKPDKEAKAERKAEKKAQKEGRDSGDESEEPEDANEGADEDPDEGDE